jgi:hypothetical protein
VTDRTLGASRSTDPFDAYLGHIPRMTVRLISDGRELADRDEPSWDR